MSFRKKHTYYFKMLIFFICLCNILQPQLAQEVHTQRNCGDAAYLQYRISQQPALKEAMVAFEKETQARMAKASTSKIKEDIIIIPTVVHLIWSSNAPNSNISDEQIQSQLDVLNADFRRQNADTIHTREVFKPVAADLQIEFHLATVDPDGQPTTGIERRETDIRTFNTSTDAMKYTSQGGLNSWNPSYYLNIWVVDDLGSGLLGFAQPPSFLNFSRSTDGIVIADHFFGTIGTVRAPFHLGRTTTHEVGHWLNLNHPWGPSNEDSNCLIDDGVTDTPPTPAPNYSCSFSANSCSLDNPNQPDMVENFMDYTNDACMNIYTQGQKLRVYSILDPGGIRHSLLSSPGFEAPLANDLSFLALQYSATTSEPIDEPLCTAFTPTMELRNLGSEVIYFVLIDYILDGMQVKNVLVDFSANPLTFQDQRTFELPLIHTFSEEEEHFLVVDIVSLNGMTDEKIEDNQLTLNFTTVPVGRKTLTETFAAGFPPENWLTVNEDEAVTFEAVVLAEAEEADTVLYINNFDYTDAEGAVDEFVLPDLDLKANHEQLYLNFLRAYAQQEEEETPDVLTILLSTDCRATYSPIYEKSGADLATAIPTKEAFIPTTTDWVSESVDLSAFTGLRNVSIKFVHTRGEGNNLYLGAIYTDHRTADVVGIPSTLTNKVNFKLYPNPAIQQTMIQLNVKQATLTQVIVMDYAGKIVYQQDWQVQTGDNQLVMELPNVNSGLYLVNVYTAEGVVSEKLLLMGKE